MAVAAGAIDGAAEPLSPVCETAADAGGADGCGLPAAIKPPRPRPRRDFDAIAMNDYFPPGMKSVWPTTMRAGSGILLALIISCCFAPVFFAMSASVSFFCTV